jgi:N utilization substance protein B
VWALYQADLLSKPVAETLPRDATMFTRELARLVDDFRPEFDTLIAAHARGWTLDRIAPLERAILRTGLAEMIYPYFLPAEEPIPPEGAIDEAVQTAKEFCGADAPAFVNGILAAVLRERADTNPGSAPPA